METWPGLQWHLITDKAGACVETWPGLQWQGLNVIPMCNSKSVGLLVIFLDLLES